MSASSESPELQSVGLVFPGQGSQFAGMASDLFEASSAARRVLEQADHVLGYPLTKIMAGDHGDDLNRTVHTQPAVFVHSMAVLEAVKDLYDLKPAMAAGHSLGEYSALTAAGVMDFPQALRLVSLRAQAMDAAQPAGLCGMLAVLGLSAQDVLDIVAQCRGDRVLEAANFNSPDQLVVSGHVSALEQVAGQVKARKRTRAVMLPVSSAFHTSLMEPARERLAHGLDGISLNPPGFPVLSNVTAQPYPSAEQDMKRLLTEQLVKPVRWEQCVANMIAAGCKVFLEIGPGKVLTGLLKRIDSSVRCAPVSDFQAIRSMEVAPA